MDFTKLSRGELDEALRVLVSSSPVGEDISDRLQQIVHELQVHRCELEMQNRALQDTQAELESSVHRYTDLYDSLPIGYVTLSPKGQIIEANHTAIAMLQGSRPRLDGKFLHTFMSEKDGERLAVHLATCLESDARQVTEVTLEVPEQRPIIVQLSSRRAQAGPDQGWCIRTAITDVSELKDAQRVLEDVIAEQESFAYSISHDLRAPLITITNFTALLLDGSIGSDPGEMRDTLDRIRRAGMRMDELLQNLLEYSRVSRAHAPMETLNLGDVIRDVLAQHQGLIEDQKAKVQVQDCGLNAYGSRTLCGQAIGNLLTNAIKYAKPGTVPTVTISVTEQSRSLVVCVADEGIGIPRHHFDRIFRIFERLHTQAVYPGTGIGLALVRRAAERMHGRVWVESEEGKGSRFFIELPKVMLG
jgi:chemotaxis family two-component system sensor kinase Cph1